MPAFRASIATLIATSLAWAPVGAVAHTLEPAAPREPAASGLEFSPAAPKAKQRVDPILLTGITAALASVALVTATFAWWRDDGYQGWSLRQTGWFGRYTYAGGSDKLGHIFTPYLGTRILGQSYLWIGVDNTTAAITSAAFVFAMSTLVELVDGFTKFGFEWQDTVANALGVGFALIGDLIPAVDALVGLRLGYLPTQKFFEGKKSYFKVINDYGGMIFYLDLKPAGLERAFGVSAGPARFFCFGLTYGTQGYDPRVGQRRRNLGAHVGLNVPEILLALFSADAPTIASTARFTKYYALPFASLMLNHDLNFGKERINYGVANRLEH